ncbi:low molecular weight protein arginine phosphatase [candidate division KSB1 bacterium]
MHRNILFVCTGNICRSPMAEGILKVKAEELDIEVASAGTHAYDGLPASGPAVDFAENLGIDISGHSSRRLSGDMLKKADLVLVMAYEHLDFVGDNYPEFMNKVFLLREFGRESDAAEDPEVHDPVGGNERNYKECILILMEEIGRILPVILSNTSD